MQQSSLKRSANGYNSLNDPHLQNYFTNKNVTINLKKAGVVTRKGEIVPDAIYRANQAHAERRRRSREELTEKLLSKSINLQRKYESEIQHRLEEISKLELIRRIQLETRTGNKFGMKLKNKRKFKRNMNMKDDGVTGGKRGDESVEQNSQITEEQETSPEQQVESYTDRSYNYMPKDYMTNDYMTNDYKTNDYTTNDYMTNDYMTNDYMTNDYMTNDYMTNDYMTNDYLTTDYMTTNEYTPVTDHTCSYMNSTYPEHSMLSPLTDPSYYSYCSECDKQCLVLDPVDLLPYSGKPCLLDPNTSVRFHDNTVAPLLPTVNCMLCPCETCAESCSKLPVTLIFVGCSTTCIDEPTEIHIEQQHNCDAVFCIYQQCHYINDTFTFVSHHEHNFPFILYVYLNGMLHLKINTCCEYKYLPGCRLGGKRGQFILIDVKGTSCCTLCEESFTKFQEEISESLIRVESAKTEEEDIDIDVPHNAAEVSVPLENIGMSMVIDLDNKKSKPKAVQRGNFEICDSDQTTASPPSSALSGSSACRHEYVVKAGKEPEPKCTCTTHHSTGVDTEQTESSHSPCSAATPVELNRDEVSDERRASQLSCPCSHHSGHHHHHPCLHHYSSTSSNTLSHAHVCGGDISSGSVGSDVATGAISGGEKASAVTNKDGNYEEDKDNTTGSHNAKVDTAVKHVEEKDFDGDDEDNISVDDIQSVSQHYIDQAEQQLSPQQVLYYQNSNENNALKRTSPQDSISQRLYLDANLLNMKLEKLQQEQQLVHLQQEGLQDVEEQDQQEEQEDLSTENRNKKDLLTADSLQDTDGLPEVVEPVPDDVDEEDNNTIHTSISNDSSSSNDGSDDNTGRGDNVSSNDSSDDDTGRGDNVSSNNSSYDDTGRGDNVSSNDNINSNDVNNNDIINTADTVDNNLNATTSNHINKNDHNNNNTRDTPLDLVHKSTQVMLLVEQDAAAKAQMVACTSEMGTQVTIKDMQKQQLDETSDFRKSEYKEDTVSLITKFENSVLWKNTNFVLPESALQKQKTAPS